MKIRSLVACALIAMIVGSGAALYAFQKKVSVNVGFEFNAGGTTFPAGNYQILAGRPAQFQLTIRNVDTGNQQIVPSTSRLASRRLEEPELVFDASDGKMFLSEVHLPGTDGYYIAGAKGEHTHKVITGKE